MRRITHLGRSFDLDDRHHRTLVVLVGSAAVGAGIRPLDATVAVAMLQAATTVALAWGTIRELGPDRPGWALVGAGAAGAVTVATGTTSLPALVGLMVATRLLTRSTGRVALMTDVVVIGLFAGIFARTPLTWATGLAVGAAVALDTTRPFPAPMRHLWLAGAIGVAVTVSAVVSGAMDVRWEPPGLATIGVAAVAWACLLIPPGQPATLNDQGGQFHAERIRSARLLALTAVTLGTAVGGAATAAASWPLWATLVASGAAARPLPGQDVDSR